MDSKATSWGSGSGSGATLPPLPQATTKETVATCPNRYSSSPVTEILTHITADLLSLDTKSTLWHAPKPSPYTVSLSTLHNRLRSGKPSPNTLSRTNTPKSNGYDVDSQSQRSSSSSTSPSSASSSTASSTSSSPYSFSPRSTKTPANHTHTHTPQLADFEDTYYALVSKILEIHSTLAIRVNNGFASFTTPIYASGPSIANIAYIIQQYWAILNDPALVKTLDVAIREHSRAVSVEHGMQPEEESETGTAVEKDVPGLSWINSWAPSMINAWLEEKYRLMLGAEKAETEREKKEKRRREVEEYKRRQAWENGYAEGGDDLEREGLRMEFEMRADSVQRYGKWLRESAGGNVLGLGETDWMPCGRDITF